MSDLPQDGTDGGRGKYGWDDARHEVTSQEALLERFEWCWKMELDAICDPGHYRIEVGIDNVRGVILCDIRAWVLGEKLRVPLTWWDAVKARWVPSVLFRLGVVREIAYSHLIVHHEP